MIVFLFNKFHKKYKLMGLYCLSSIKGWISFILSVHKIKLLNHKNFFSLFFTKSARNPGLDCLVWIQVI